MNGNKWALTDAEKEKLTLELTPELALLRSKAGISQGDLANIIGVSRQTYGSIERKTQPLTWNTYLSLILFYEYNHNTRPILHSLGIFPRELIARFNDGVNMSSVDLNSFFEGNTQEIIGCLDEQALRSIKTMVMVEYARCTGMTGDAVIKAFEGITFSKKSDNSNDVSCAKAIKAIRKRKNDKQP